MQELKRQPNMDSGLPKIVQTMAQMFNDVADSFTKLVDGLCGFSFMDFEQSQCSTPCRAVPCPSRACQLMC